MCRDVSQLQQMLLKAKGYGYRQVGFILDRGYFSKENIHFMDKNGYEFIIMMKGMKSLVRDLSVVFILSPALIHIILVFTFTTAKYTVGSAGNKDFSAVFTYLQ